MRIVGVMPVYEEADWIEYAVEGIIDFVDELIITEGYTGAPWHFWANRSSDGTLEILEKLKKRYDKIKVLKSPWHLTKERGKAWSYNRMVRASMYNEPDNWIFVVDADEFYTNEQLGKIRATLEETDKDLISVHARMFVYNFRCFIPVLHARLIRITKGMIFKPSQNPHYKNGNSYSKRPEETDTVLENDPMFHYSFVKPPIRMNKRLEMEVQGGRRSPAVLRWFEDVFMKWSEQDADDIYKKNKTITGNSGILFAGPSERIQIYNGRHPEVLNEHPFRWTKDVRLGFSIKKGLCYKFRKVKIGLSYLLMRSLLLPIKLLLKIKQRVSHICLKVNLNKYYKLQINNSHYTRKMPGFHKFIQEAVDEFIRSVPSKNDKILDAGCGDGWTLDILKELGYKNIVGIDLNPDKINIAQENGHTVYAGDLQELPFENERFNAIYCRHTFEHILYPRKAISEFHRVLKPGGIIFVIAPKTSLSGPHVQKISSVTSITKHCKRLNFRILDCKAVQKASGEFWVLAKK